MNKLKEATSRVMRFSKNLKGRDFVIGDIHGAYDTVWQAMKAADFDMSCDRLFSSGDLVDRGPGSHRCAQFLKQPYVHAVRGNHDDDLVDFYKDGPPDPDILAVVCNINHNGMRWIRDVPVETMLEIVNSLNQLPIVIELETNRGMVGIVHGDVPANMHWSDFVARVEAGDPDVIKTALCGRDRIENEIVSGVEGIGRVFVGHTIDWRGVQRYGNLYALDCGAVFGEMGKSKGHLTIADVQAGTMVLSAPREVDPARPLVDLRSDDQVSCKPFFNISDSDDWPIAAPR